MTARENDLLKRLEKRREWLTQRIYKNAKDKEDLSHDRAELSALDWGIGIIEIALKVKEKECSHLWALLPFRVHNNNDVVFCQKCLEMKDLQIV